MIRLSEIDVENRNEFGKDVCPRIRDLLLKERENQDFDAIFNYCSCDGQLNDCQYLWAFRHFQKAKPCR